MPRPQPLPEDLPDSFAVAAALRAGVTSDRLRSSDLVAHFHGGRIKRGEPAVGDEYAKRLAELQLRCRAYLPVAPTAFAFSHVTAAQLYGMPLPEPLRRRLTLDVATSGAAQPRSKGVIGHRIELGDVRVLRELPVVAPEQCWLPLAATLTLDDLVVAGDFLVRRKGALSTIAQLSASMLSATGARGVVNARNAFADIRPGTDSPPETYTRLVLIRARLPEPTVGHTVIDDDGYFVGTPDLAYIAERIALEYEGEIHRTDVSVYDDDIDRRERFERAGWRVIRVRARHLRDPRGLAERVRIALVERGARL